MAVILPFEENFYHNRGMDVEYVGHPLLDTIPHNLDKGKIIEEMGLEKDRWYVRPKHGKFDREAGTFSIHCRMPPWSPEIIEVNPLSAG